MERSYLRGGRSQTPLLARDPGACPRPNHVRAYYHEYDHIRVFDYDYNHTRARVAVRGRERGKPSTLNPTP